MAIPPIGAKVIVEAILKTLYDVDYEYVPPNIDHKILTQKELEL